MKNKVSYRGVLITVSTEVAGEREWAAYDANGDCVARGIARQTFGHGSHPRGSFTTAYHAAKAAVEGWFDARDNLATPGIIADAEDFAS